VPLLKLISGPDGLFYPVHRLNRPTRLQMHPSAGNRAALPQAITGLGVMCYRQVLQIDRDQFGVQAALADPR
jgi:hypothetical protein